MNGTLRERALRLLARREHSRAELMRKLAPHAETAADVDAVLDDLTRRGLLSDERYVDMRMRARAARLGDARLAYELRTQGVSEDLVDAALAGGESERVRAQAVWQRKFGLVASDAGERARQIRFLASRGFSAETIRRVVRGDFEDD